MEPILDQGDSRQGVSRRRLERTNAGSQTYPPAGKPALHGSRDATRNSEPNNSADGSEQEPERRPNDPVFLADGEHPI